MKYKNAFKCTKCPESNGENGCPVWWEIIEENVETGKERINKACGFTLMQMFLLEVLKASNRPAAAVESMRNDLVKGIGGLPEVIMRAVQLAPTIPPLELPTPHEDKEHLS